MKSSSDRMVLASVSAGVLDSTMHYLEIGSGLPVVFLHGNPTSSYLWRNVLPAVVEQGWRCIALDLIGMGASGKPDSGYRLSDHIRYVDAFLESLGSDVVLVGHDWGAVIALDHARRFAHRTRGVAFLEGHIHPVDRWADLGDGAELFRRLRTPGVGERMILEDNLFVESVLPAGILRALTSEEWDAYRAPFVDPTSRWPMLRWVQEIPIDGHPPDVADLVTANQATIADPAIPKLLLHATPGAVIGQSEVDWCRRHGRSIDVVDLGAGTHFLPEDRPQEIATALLRWLPNLHTNCSGGR